MKNQKTTSRNKKGGGLKSKHLLIGLFAVAVGAVCGAVIGLMQTSLHTQTDSSPAASAASGVVEVWAPRGASAPVTVIESAQLVQEETVEQHTGEMAEASAPDEQEAAAASSPSVAERPQKAATNRAQRKKAVQKKKRPFPIRRMC